MRYLINYANENYRSAQKLNTWSARIIARFDRIIEYSDKDIDGDFYCKNKRILDIKRGNGLWLWKPYIIEKTLRNVSDGDIVFYCDSGAYFHRYPKELWTIMESIDFWIAELPLVEYQFTKKSVLDKYDVSGKFRNSPQYQAGFMCIKKNEKNMQIIREWLDACQEIDMIKPENSMKNECTEFISHREDQSLLSLILKKNGIPGHQDPTQYIRFPELYWRKFEEKIVRCNPQAGEYKPFIILHRRKKISVKILAMPFYYFCLPKTMVLRLTRR